LHFFTGWILFSAVLAHGSGQVSVVSRVGDPSKLHRLLQARRKIPELALVQKPMKSLSVARPIQS
jgi:hypothetical protein